MNRKRVNFLESVEKFLLSTEALAADTKRTYRAGLKQFFSWFKSIQKKREGPKRKTILLYKEIMMEQKGLRPATQASYLVALRTFFAWTESLNLYPNIAKGIRGPRRALKHHQKDSLTPSQIKKILSCLPSLSTLEGRRDKAILDLMLRAGIKMREIAAINYKDLKINDNEAILHIPSNDNFIVIVGESFKSLLAYRPMLGYFRDRPTKSVEPLFTSLASTKRVKRLTIQIIARIVTEYLHRAGIKNDKITAESLRHTFGTTALKAGATLYEVQQAMGHSSQETTLRYVEDLKQQDRLNGNSAEKKLNDLLSEDVE